MLCRAITQRRLAGHEIGHSLYFSARDLYDFTVLGTRKKTTGRREIGIEGRRMSTAQRNGYVRQIRKRERDSLALVVNWRNGGSMKSNASKRCVRHCIRPAASAITSKRN